MKIYTKTGDDGTTGLQGGKRVLKSDLRIIAYGAVDEANSSLGVALSHDMDADIRELLTRIQNELFVAGSDLSNPDLGKKDNRITEQMVENLEKNIDRFEAELSPLTNFILPGGHQSAAHLHMARTVSRRAETDVVALAKDEQINSYCQKYLNRLSDLLFVLARVVNKRNGTSDVVWKP
ncbi:cob(I)yrinic acid a,c-diamide adenosyltransferase [Candidatus Nitrosotenuis chungbukensis]|uniref:cob(I)yrinic acid a,c-diamide adenosyltransferase n=1 Tax=Candidatus Nitrosotenuis chungbukensis TaxID=1353246 RepID=UPI0005B2C2FC|nr:cob(I)yrinic acid a,c-diamide adenosyltransferase [Candidatus Nitrosotenuis chungbukensis]WKT57529.1 cob(I)yrinic acid a,c-diamide adenosyltransferase [Candidatus Nitrosotenuis chungbukensis]